MLKKANQKRRLDEMVIAEGDFTTDYLQKLDWRDYLDDGQLEELGVDATNEAEEGKNGGAIQSAAEIRQALAAAEDEEDAAAAKAAVAEMDVDRSDFAGDQQGGASTVTKDGLVKTNGDGVAEVEEEDDPLKGSVDGFMVDFVEDNWELFD